MSSALSALHFHNEEPAYAFVERRLWVNGPVCPHCGGVKRIGKMAGKSTRVGTYKCYQCRKPFTVKIGTIFEASHVAMHIWLQAMYLISGSKKGISSNHLHRILGVSLKTAGFMSHRIRKAMRSGGMMPFGSGGGIVELDETFIGHDQTIKPEGEKKSCGYAHKYKGFSPIDRETGRQRSIIVDSLRAVDLTPLLKANIAAEAHIMTDKAGQYKNIGFHFAEYDFARHGVDQYVDYENPQIHTNTIECTFSIFKRGMKGTYQHCAKKHLHRYVAEFEFRYTNRIATGFNDPDRADAMLAGVVGKHLTYNPANGTI